MQYFVDNTFRKFVFFQEMDKIDSSDDGICPLKLLSHSLGSFINKIVFGRSWPADDPTWIWLQELQENGVQQMSVAGPLNFLPFVR